MKRLIILLLILISFQGKSQIMDIQKFQNFQNSMILISSGEDTLYTDIPVIDTIKIIKEYLQKYESQLGTYEKLEPYNCLPASGYKVVIYEYCPDYFEFKRFINKYIKK